MKLDLPALFNDGKMPAKHNGKWGYVDESFAFVIAPTYDEANPFENNHAIVKIGDGYHLIDGLGVVQNQNGYRMIRDAGESGVYTYQDLSGWGLIRFDGSVLYQATIHEPFSLSFLEGFARVYNGSQYGFLNHQGEIVVPYSYEEAGYFVDGVACVKMNGKYGLIDKMNNVVLPFQYDHIITPGPNNLATTRVSTASGPLSVLINRQGETLIGPSQMIQPVKNWYLVMDDEPGLYDSAGDLVYAGVFHHAYEAKNYTVLFRYGPPEDVYIALNTAGTLIGTFDSNDLIVRRMSDRSESLFLVVREGTNHTLKSPDKIIPLRENSEPVEMAGNRIVLRQGTAFGIVDLQDNLISAFSNDTKQIRFFMDFYIERQTAQSIQILDWNGELLFEYLL